MNRPKMLGTSAETAVVRWLAANGHPYAERRSLTGNFDKGDVTGIPGVCIEVKVAKSRGVLLGPWMRETEVERVNANAAFGLLVVKTNGLGPARTGQWLTSMRRANWQQLVASGGYPTHMFHDDNIVSGNTLTQLPTRLANEWDPGKGPLLVRARGKLKVPEEWHVVATLAFMNMCLLNAGHGDRESVTSTW